MTKKSSSPKKSTPATDEAEKPRDQAARDDARAGALQRLLLVSIHSTETKADNKDEAPAETPPGPSEDLERELKYTRENLQTTIEELETSNEELNTVNAELKSKLEALARSNDDMNNLLNSMQVATVFLDNDLRVKRYTKQAQDIVRLIESDIGRPLSDLTCSLRYDDLIADCRNVLDTLVPIEKEVRDQEGRYFLVRLLPYRTADNVIDGVVLTIVDIDRAKTAEKRADAGEIFEAIVQTVRHPLLVLDADLRVVQANKDFYRAFDTRAEQTAGRLVYELGAGQWDIPDLRRLLEDILPSRTAMTDYPVEHDFPAIGRRTFLLNARQLRLDAARTEMILLAFEDVTGKKSTEN